MTEFLMALGVILGPTYVICGLVAHWARRTPSRILSRILRISALFWALALTLAFAVHVAIAATCDGSVLYGFTRCTLFGGTMANTLGVLTIASFAVGAAYGVALLVGGLIYEAVLRRRT